VIRHINNIIYIVCLFYNTTTFIILKKLFNTREKVTSFIKEVIDNKKVLHLNLYRKYFDEIVSGKKTIEYRDKTPYWTTRLSNKNYDYIYFRNGYSKDAPMMLVEYKGVDITDQFEITLGEVLYVWNVR
tara:strand:+ start:164 stop:550 length:387 start_codon:yes stop_codon:yes gene_type:complete